MPDGPITCALDLAAGEPLVRCLQLLQTNDIGPRLVEPPQQHLKAAVDALDVVGGELNRTFPSVLAVALVALTRLRVVLGIVARVGG